METLRHVVLLVHLVGFATLFGAWVVEAFGQRGINRVMQWGLVITTLGGFILAAPWGLAEGAALNYPKIATKLVILIIIGGLLGIGSARQRKNPDSAVPAAIFWLIGLLTLVNASLAVLW